MVKVFYAGYPVHRTNAWLGGVLFSEGVAEFDSVEEGIRFAGMFYLKYEVVEVASKSKKKVVKADVE